MLGASAAQWLCSRHLQEAPVPATFPAPPLRTRGRAVGSRALGTSWGLNENSGVLKTRSHQGFVVKHTLRFLAAILNKPLYRSDSLYGYTQS